MVHESVHIICGVVLFAYLAVGSCLAISGSLLPRLQHNTGVSLRTISIAFSARAAAFVFASIAAGPIVLKFNALAVLGLSLAACSITVVVTPYASSITVLFVVLAIQGFTLGTVDCLGNVILLKMRMGPSWIQALHAFFGVGTMLGSAIAGVSLRLTGNVIIGYFVLSVFQIAVAGSSLFCHAFYGAQTTPSAATLTKRTSRWDRLTVACGLVLFAYVGSEIATGNYLSLFAQYRGLEESTSVFVVTAFWLSLAVFRFVAIVASMYLSPTAMLSIDFAGALITSIVFIVAPHNESILILIAIAMGGFYASAYPCIVSMAEFMAPLEGINASILFGLTSFGEIVVPALTGLLLDTVGVWLLPYTITVTLLAGLVGFGVVSWMRTHRPSERIEPCVEEELGLLLPSKKRPEQ